MAIGAEGNDFRICEEHLALVSRTFALNIRVLRGDDYRSILLAYLLCRIADTIEDEPSLSAASKIECLADYEKLFPLRPNWPEQVKDFVDSIPIERSGHDRKLLFDAPRVLGEFSKLPLRSQLIVSEHVREMSRGMALFQEKALDGCVVMLEDRNELERYCYYVAGTVGLMITKLFFGNAGDGKVSRETYECLHSRSVAFGLGLQLTNIAKDYMGDLHRGWCYVPRSLFHGAGQEDAFPENSKCNRDVRATALEPLVDMALTNLDRAIEYVLAIPRRYARRRLFCIWPLMMAVETLALVRRDRYRLLDGAPVKIERSDVKRIIRSGTRTVFSNYLVRRLYDAARQEAAGVPME